MHVPTIDSRVFGRDGDVIRGLLCLVFWEEEDKSEKSGERQKQKAPRFTYGSRLWPIMKSKRSEIGEKGEADETRGQRSRAHRVISYISGVGTHVTPCSARQPIFTIWAYAQKSCVCLLRPRDPNLVPWPGIMGGVVVC